MANLTVVAQIDRLFLWQNKQSEGRWLLALAKPLKNVMAEVFPEPQLPSAYVSFGRIGLLADREVHKETIWPGTAHIVSHTKNKIDIVLARKGELHSV